MHGTTNIKFIRSLSYNGACAIFQHGPKYVPTITHIQSVTFLYPNNKGQRNAAQTFTLLMLRYLLAFVTPCWCQASSDSAARGGCSSVLKWVLSCPVRSCDVMRTPNGLALLSAYFLRVLWRVVSAWAACYNISCLLFHRRLRVSSEYSLNKHWLFSL